MEIGRKQTPKVAMVTSNELRRKRVNRNVKKHNRGKKQAPDKQPVRRENLRPQENVFDPFISASTVQQPRVCFFEGS